MGFWSRRIRPSLEESLELFGPDASYAIGVGDHEVIVPES